MKRISVIIPTYNSSLFLAATLESVFCQTREPDEIIVSDDCSTDGTPEMVEAIAGTSPIPIWLIRSAENSGGPARPLNAGIARAKGDLIATLDHDDLMRPNRLERQVAAWESDTTQGLIIARCSRKSSSGQELQIVQAAMIAVEKLPRRTLGSSFYRIESVDASKGVVSGCFALTCSTFLFPKWAWEARGGFNEKLISSCDYGFLGALARSFPIGYVNEILVDWNERDSSLFHGTNRLRRSAERLMVLDQLYRESMETDLKRLIRAEVQRELLDNAYHSRECGDYQSALHHYLLSMRHNGFSREAIFGIVKLLPHRLLLQHHPIKGGSRTSRTIS